MKKYFIFIGILLGLSGCAQEMSVVEEEPVTLTWYVNFSWFDKSWGEDVVSQYITEKTGINVKYVAPTGDESMFLQSLLSSNATADLITFEPWDPLYSNFLDQNVFAPLDILGEKYESKFMDYTNTDTVQWYAYENHLYVYPNASYPLGMEQSYSNQSFLVRKDIYEGIGSPDMTTPEGFLSALEMAKEFCPTVGGKELIPLGLQEFSSTGNTALEDYLQNFLAIAYEEAGVVVDRLVHSDSILWLETMNEAYRRDLLSIDIFVDKRVQMEEKIAEGQYFAMLYQWSDCTEQLMELYNHSPEKRYIPVDGPKNLNGDEHTLAGSSVQGWTVTGIAENSLYKEESLELLTFLMSDEGQKLIFMGIEGVTYEEGVDGFQRTEEAQLFLEENPTGYAREYGGTDVLWPLMNPAYAEEKGYLLGEHSYFQDIKSWSEDKTLNFSLYTYPEFTQSSPVYNIAGEDALRKGSMLVELITAESSEKFHEIWGNFLLEREESGYEKVMEVRQQQLDENKIRLAQWEGIP